MSCGCDCTRNAIGCTLHSARMPLVLQPGLLFKLLPWLLTLLLRQLCRLQSTVATAAVGSAVPTMPPEVFYVGPVLTEGLRRTAAGGRRAC
jgi:hypothetical protein